MYKITTFAEGCLLNVVILIHVLFFNDNSAQTFGTNLFSSMQFHQLNLLFSLRLILQIFNLTKLIFFLIMYWEDILTVVAV